MPVGKVYQAPSASSPGSGVFAPKLMHNPFLEQDARKAAPVKRNFVVPPKKLPGEIANGSLQVCCISGVNLEFEYLT